MNEIERALVAFARGSGAWVLYASGRALTHAIDQWGRDADEIGLLRSRAGWHVPMRGLWVWEGIPQRASVDGGPWVPTFTEGIWRALTDEEWAKVRAGDVTLWPTTEAPGFEEPRP